MSSHPTSKARCKRQKLKRKYARAREDCQLLGVCETSPSGALKPERVDPAVQSDGAPALTASLVMKALREGWPVPPATAARYVDLLGGIMRDPDVPARAKLAAFKALLLADRTQWERDQAEEAGRAKGGGTVSASVQANAEMVALIRRTNAFIGITTDSYSGEI